MLTTEEKNEMKKRYDFHWGMLDVIVGGKSMVDSIEGLSGFLIESMEDADRFIRCYGFDLDHPIEQAEVLGNYHESINFVRKSFLKPENPEGLELEIPRKILELQDIRELVLLASPSRKENQQSPKAKLYQAWACALLKVVHSIAHMDKDVRTSYFGDIQKQILDRYYKFIHRDESGQLYLGEGTDDPRRIDLISFETKPKKSRESMLLKLLHKSESVAEDIFDQVGIRFVTATPLDALRVVKYLKDSMIIMPANVKPSRSRNTLIDLEVLRPVLADYLSHVESGDVDEAKMVKEINSQTRFTSPGGAGASSGTAENRHTSEFYRSIHFTLRQFIKLRNPIYDKMKKLKALSKKGLGTEEVSKVIDGIDLKYLQREVRFFYPYEVQVMDQEGFEDSQKGLSAHSEYKKAQTHTAMQRVMGSLIGHTN